MARAHTTMSRVGETTDLFGGPVTRIDARNARVALGRVAAALVSVDTAKLAPAADRRVADLARLAAGDWHPVAVPAASRCIGAPGEDVAHASTVYVQALYAALYRAGWTVRMDGVFELEGFRVRLCEPERDEKGWPAAYTWNAAPLPAGEYSALVMERAAHYVDSCRATLDAQTFDPEGPITAARRLVFSDFLRRWPAFINELLDQEIVYAREFWADYDNANQPALYLAAIAQARADLLSEASARDYFEEYGPRDAGGEPDDAGDYEDATGGLTPNIRALCRLTAEQLQAVVDGVGAGHGVDRFIREALEKSGGTLSHEQKAMVVLECEECFGVGLLESYKSVIGA
jgi:hypothetical protein